MTDDLAAWLLDRIAEDEATARASVAASEPDEPWGYDHLPGDGPHIARWDPARVLAECEAKRRIVDLHPEGEHDCPGQDWTTWPTGPCSTLRALALPYADRPGYRQEWTP